MKGRDMLGNNLERIKAEAMLELGDDDAALGQLWNRVYAAFDQWKQEQGNRKPKAYLGMLSDLVGAKSIPFKKAEPWQCADFMRPSGPITLALKLLYEDYPPFKAITAEVGIRKVLALLIVGFGDDATEDELNDAMRILHDHALIERTLHAGVKIAKQWQSKNLAKGPVAAAKDRTDKAAIKNAPLITDIQSVLGEHPFWSGERILNHLLKDGNPYGKTRGTILGDVKVEKAKYRNASS